MGNLALPALLEPAAGRGVTGLREHSPPEDPDEKKG